MSNSSTVCQFKSAARSDKILADYLKIILEEVRTLRVELKKLDTELTEDIFSKTAYQQLRLGKHLPLCTGRIVAQYYFHSNVWTTY